jgi:hypothetical protein
VVWEGWRRKAPPYPDQSTHIRDLEALQALERSHLTERLHSRKGKVVWNDCLARRAGPQGDMRSTSTTTHRGGSHGRNEQPPSMRNYLIFSTF